MSPAQPSDSSAMPLRPTRAAFCAPFVCAPPAPRVARAPAVSVAAAVDTRRAAEEAPWLALEGASSTALALVQVPENPAWLSSLGALALEVRALEPVGEVVGPVESASTLGRVSRVASALGALGAFLGAVAFAGGEGALPLIGSLPGPLIGGAAGAGVLGLAGVALGALGAIVARGRAPRRQGMLAYVRVRSGDRDALLALLSRGGGRVVACSSVA